MNLVARLTIHINVQYRHTNHNESNAEWSSHRTPTNYFSVYVYASHFILGVFVRRSIWAFWPNFLAYNTPVRPLTEALAQPRFERFCSNLVFECNSDRLPKAVMNINFWSIPDGGRPINWTYSNHNNSAAYSSISLKFCTTFGRVTADTLQTFKIKSAKVKVTT